MPVYLYVVCDYLQTIAELSNCNGGLYCLPKIFTLCPLQKNCPIPALV